MLANWIEQHLLATSLVVPWLRPCACTAGAVGSITGWGINIPHAVQPKKPKTPPQNKISLFQEAFSLLQRYEFTIKIP